MTRLRLGIVGAGRFAPAHLRACAVREDVELVGITNRTPERAAALAEAFGVAQVYPDPEALIEGAAPEGIVIVTASEAHEPVARLALERGVGVLVEKPVGGRAAVAERLAEVAERTGSPLLAGHILRFAEPYRSLARDVHAGAFGRLVGFAARRDRSIALARTYDTHPALLTAIHDIDLVLWLSGSRVRRLRALEARASGLERPVGVWAHLELDDGSVAAISSMWLHPEAEPQAVSDRLEVYGAQGAGSVEVEGEDVRVRTASGEWRAQDVLTPQDGGGAIGSELAHFLDLLRERRQSEVVPLADVVEGLRAAEAIIESAGHTGAVVDLGIVDRGDLGRRLRTR